LICHSLFNRWQEHRRKRLEEEDIQTVLNEVVEASASHMVVTWGRLSTEEKAILAALAEMIMGDARQPGKR